MSIITKTLGIKLRKLREDANLSCSKVSEIIRKNRNTYSRIEKGEAVIDVISMIKFCQLYEITPNEMLNYSEAEQ